MTDTGMSADNHMAWASCAGKYGANAEVRQLTLEGMELALKYGS
jgi:hypothetical protein